MNMKPQRKREARGMVTIGLLLALVLLQLVVVGVINGGARDHELTARRSETMRALYAAEAGVNMAVREIMTATDEDGDGGIGTISDDGDDANDPTVAGGSVVVTSLTAGAQTTLTSVGRAGLARRSVEAAIE